MEELRLKAVKSCDSLGQQHEMLNLENNDQSKQWPQHKMHSIITLKKLEQKMVIKSMKSPIDLLAENIFPCQIVRKM